MGAFYGYFPWQITSSITYRFITLIIKPHTYTRCYLHFLIYDIYIYLKYNTDYECYIYFSYLFICKLTLLKQSNMLQILEKIQYMIENYYLIVVVAVVVVRYIYYLIMYKYHNFSYRCKYSTTTTKTNGVLRTQKYCKKYIFVYF